MMEWLFLLLPVAAASGWWVARRGNLPRGGGPSAPDPAFFRGLNYLLDEQPDKAIDVFLKLAEMDQETVETHLALGSLFRRRGEVDRAIRIHQGLVARTDLGRNQRADALYELGQDYLRAGLFDRAERLFGELVERKLHRRRALEALRDIYQQEKDWVRCLEVAQKLATLTGVPMATEIAQYHCELAEEALKADQTDRAERHLRDAQAADAACVRATMLQARMETGRGDYAAAVALYERVAGQGPRFLPEILPEMIEASRRGGRTRLAEPLGRLYAAHPSPALVLALSEAVREEQGDEAAAALLTRHLGEYADLTGLERLLELSARRPLGEPLGRSAQEAVLGVARHLRARTADYQCDHCGFEARRLHWQCPSCKHWGSIKPVEPYLVTPAKACVPDRRIA